MNMKKMLTRRHGSTIKHKLIALVVGHLLLFFMLFYGLFFWFQNVLEEKISDIAMQTTGTIAGNVEVYLQSQIRLSLSISSESSLNKLLKENPDFADSGSIWAMVQLLDRLKSFSAINQNIYSIGIYNVNSGKVLTTADGIYNAPKAAREWAQEMTAGMEPMRVGVDYSGSIPPYLSGSPEMISVLRVLPGKADNILMINSHRRLLDQVIGDIKLWEGTSVVITDVGRQSFFVAGDSGLELANALLSERSADSDAYETIRHDKRKYIAVSKSSESSGWGIHLIIPHGEIMGDVLLVQRAAILIMTGIALLVLMLFWVLYLQIFGPIRRLMQGMVQVEKGVTYQPIEIRRMDELGFLQQRFNEMVQHEQHMQKTLLDEQLHKKDIELKFLQSQVNPHFLYNTLDSIYWVAEQSGVEDISEVVLDLSRFFRLSLSRGKDYVTIRETVDQLECYVRIQQFRHTDKFEVDWMIEERVKSLYVMKLMLQPVVENAIVHSLERTADPCRLAVSIVQEDDWLVCTVTDTGVGMDPGELEHLQQEIRREGGPSVSTYGLRNLYQRLLIQYGEDMDFQLWSKLREGTTVTIRIRLGRLRGEKHEELESDHR